MRNTFFYLWKLFLKTLLEKFVFSSELDYQFLHFIYLGICLPMMKFNAEFRCNRLRTYLYVTIPHIVGKMGQGGQFQLFFVQIIHRKAIKNYVSKLDKNCFSIILSLGNLLNLVQLLEQIWAHSQKIQANQNQCCSIWKISNLLNYQNNFDTDSMIFFSKIFLATSN